VGWGMEILGVAIEIEDLMAIATEKGVL